MTNAPAVASNNASAPAATAEKRSQRDVNLRRIGDQVERAELRYTALGAMF